MCLTKWVPVISAVTKIRYPPRNSAGPSLIPGIHYHSSWTVCVPSSQMTPPHMGRDQVLTCHDLSADLNLAWDWALRWECCSVQRKKVNVCISVSRQGKHSLYPLGCPWVERVFCKLCHTSTLVHFNNWLSWVTHVDEVLVYKSCARKVGTPPRLRTKLKPASIRRIYVGANRPKTNRIWVYGVEWRQHSQTHERLLATAISCPCLH